jgi:hypothetical protein
MRAEPSFARRRLDLHVVIIAPAFLALAWALVVVVDALNLAGSRDALADRLRFPALWVQLFLAGGPVEIVQFAMLGGTVMVAAVTAGKLFAGDRRSPAAFWLLIAIGATILLIEEAGDVRFTIQEAMSTIVGEGAAQKNIMELASFALLAAVPAYAVFRYWRVPWRSALTRGYLIACFAFYTPGTLINATRNLGGSFAPGRSEADRSWYIDAGDFLHERVFAERLLENFREFAYAAPPDVRDRPAGFVLMDGPINESFELLGATFLLAAALAYAHHLHRDTAIADL